MNEKTCPPNTEWIAFLYEIRESPGRPLTHQQQHVVGATRPKAVENALKLQAKNSFVEIGVARVSLIPAKEYYELNSNRDRKT